MRFDSANLFGNLFNEWLANGNSGALTYKTGPVDAENSASDPAGEVQGSEFVDVKRKEMYGRMEQVTAIVFR
ncbi:hypothetical protein GALMADRAFT_227726 [Galerina marginata CBS 339.88]|uniref:Uncharacterized protein n=1 Tax=Galerina marginata (strain CBS 339.88) TaxID=685588 RepID=A0A067T278_GALM3|nr:hypothetical protein GALMADRAFT_227726 [Galerina marginata CBS 339.88]